MDKSATEAYVKDMLDNNLFAVIYPKDRSEKSAEKMVDMIDAAVGIAEFKDDDDNSVWGVLIDKEKAKASLKLAEDKNGTSNV